MHGNMGFTYMGIFGFHPYTWMATWGSPTQGHGVSSPHIYGDMGFFPPDKWGHGILPSHIDGGT
jgi:hypothetical protein